ncbi:hypothetical protein QK292_08755 [Arthrobacter sp. AL08]|uniref:hypothetical protein n=1 Tax=unclassified Arthrobacter TaxID=235627 RepID=UPI002499FAA1|nr:MULTISPECIES: hypothetical protein [unclassified Arthrobacter]MDI3241650.1 hypothetical protein [Arthrobacter sp. AL05]MDI3277660.1 hypothetical protein [Arthrobacter sp. AL08]
MTEHDPGAGGQVGTTGISKIVVDTAIDTVAAAIGGAAPPLAPWVAGGATFIKAMGPRLYAHQQINLDTMMGQARLSSGMEFEDFTATVENDPERLLSFVAACDAARRTALDEKIKALGRAVGDLARDDALVDESAIWIDLFSQIEAPHVRLVLALFEMDPEYPGQGYARLWNRSELRGRLGLSATVNILLNTLISVGLLREIPYEELTPHDRARWGVSGGSKYRPVYTKGPLANEFLERLQIPTDGSWLAQRQGAGATGPAAS